MHLDDVRMFCVVAQAGSFSSAARRLNISPAAVSLAIKRIEAAHRARLFERSTRSIRLTAEGQVFLAGCESILATWEDTIAKLASPDGVLEGDVHIAAPIDLTYQHLGTWLADWQRKHPRLRLTLHVSDRMHDVKRDTVDIAIRYGELPDSSLVAHRLCSAPRVAVASPRYLARVEMPTKPADLARHVAVLWSAGDQPLRDWHFWRGPKVRGAGEVVRMRGDLCADGMLARRWALEGRGIAFKVLWDVIDDLEAGRLVRVLPNYRGQEVPVHAVLPSRTHQPQRVRAVLELLLEEFKALQTRMAKALKGA